jgi:hypothetical protein
MIYEPLEVETHDYRSGTRRWGHDYTWKPRNRGYEGTIIGHGRGLKAGDYILMSHQNGDDTRYQIDSIRYANDPADMFFAELVFRPR